MQRQYNVGLMARQPPGTISLAVDKRRYPRLGQRLGPERAWPGDAADVLRTRRPYDLTKSGLVPPALGLGKTRPQQNPLPPRYSPGYTSDVSHLVV